MSKPTPAEMRLGAQVISANPVPQVFIDWDERSPVDLDRIFEGCEPIASEITAQPPIPQE